MIRLINILLTVQLFTRISVITEHSGLLARVMTITTPSGTILNSTLTPSGHHLRSIVVNVTTVDDESFTLDLHLNGHLFSKGYREKVCSEKGDYYLKFNKSSDHCYYIGKARGYGDSIASLSTCGNITGFFTVSNKSYSIVEYSKGPFTYAIVAPETSSHWTCGVLDSLIKDVRKRSKRALKEQFDRTLRFIELYAISDTSHYELFNSEFDATLRIKMVVNLAAAMFTAVDMYLALVGLEVWTKPKIAVDSNSIYNTLINFLDYKNNTLNGNSPSHDSACLFLGVSFPNDTIGLALLDAMCHSVNSGTIIKDFQEKDRKTFDFDSLGSTAALVTHEIGHTLGLRHDTNITTCYCNDFTGDCIMSPSLSAGSIFFYTSTFSSCSKTDLVSKRELGLDLCLFNVPETKEVPYCGNGILENGESCDCGFLPDNLCNKTCCESLTCKLKESASCAMGQCCDISTCQIIAKNTVCRPSQGPCDINELCNGFSAYCPTDVYKHNGISCSSYNSRAYCYEGRCKNHVSQCQYLYGSDAYTSPDFCYSYLNRLGNESGSCRTILNPVPSYIPCMDSDVKCGQLFCETSKTIPILRYEWVMRFKRFPNCVSAIFDFGKQVLTPGYVPNGAVCDSSKMCINQKCVEVDTVLSTKPCSSECPGGVCNNEGRCQCESGAEYSNCSVAIATINTKITTTTQPLRQPRKNCSDLRMKSFMKLLFFFIVANILND